MARNSKISQRAQLDAVKRAIMLEIHGLRFYEVAAQRCTNEVARELFKDLAQDEVRHRQELQRQFKHLLKGEKAEFTGEAPHKDLRFKDPVIGPDLKQRVEETWFDSAALSIGIMLEKKAMDYYRKRQLASTDKAVKELFGWLAEWEKAHLDRLMALERAMREEIWNEAQFWPLD
ncbi:MAG: ferritin family protein [bacterium]